MANSKRNPGRKRRELGGKGMTRAARHHGLSETQVTAMRERQGDRCAICMEELTPAFVIDHDHALAETHDHPVTRGCRLCIRAILCGRCNGLLGSARDNQGILQRASLYLRVARERLDRWHHPSCMLIDRSHPDECVVPPQVAGIPDLGGLRER